MIAVAETMSWGLVQRSALDGAHAAWLDDMPRSLIDAARDDPAGRRLLARRLVDAAPAIFAGFPAVLPAAIAASGWMRWPPAMLDDRSMDLGGLAYAPLLRLRIDRSEVVRIRDVLGAERYARVLAATDTGDVPVAARAALDVALASDEALHRLILVQGRKEWTAHARDVHPVALEWLRLCHSPGVIDVSASGWLGVAATSHVLALTSGEESDVRESRHH